MEWAQECNHTKGVVLAALKARLADFVGLTERQLQGKQSMSEDAVGELDRKMKSICKPTKPGMK